MAIHTNPTYKRDEAYPKLFWKGFFYDIIILIF